MRLKKKRNNGETKHKSKQSTVGNGIMKGHGSE